MGWVQFGIPGFIAFLYLCRGLYRNHRRLKLWRQALALCRGAREERASFWPWWAKLTGRSDPIEMRITRVLGTDDWTKVVIEGPEGFSVLKLRQQILKLWSKEIEVGDETFDEKFLVDGSLLPVCARLDATLRGRLVRASSACKSLSIGDGQLRAEVEDEKLLQVLPRLFDISRQLAEPVNVEQRIAENAREDPEEGVRLLNLLLLIREHPGAPETLRVLREAASDASPKVRLRAALELGEGGRDTLQKIAEEPTDDASSAKAVSHLGSKLSLKRTERIFFQALDKGFVQTALACLELLGQRGSEGVDVLEQAITREKGEIAAAAALALGATGEASVEPLLLKALQSEDGALREAAATALGHVGTVAAVPALKEAAERSIFGLDLRRNARQAIAEIQSRLEGASPGQLSLAEAEAGQLSLAASEAGQLSLAPHEVPHETDPLPPPGQRLRG